MAFPEFWRVITIFGDFQVWAAIIFAILIFYVISSKSKKQKFSWLISVLISAVLVSSAVTELLKMSIQIPRPCVGSIDCPSSYSFPSGHATRLFVLLAAVVLNTKNFGIKLSFFTMAILVSISRIALNYHTYADIIAGALIGISVTYLITALYKRKSSSIKAFKSIIS